jgi:pimeloyl-ACP methyl ester carboxylesterase
MAIEFMAWRLAMTEGSYANLNDLNLYYEQHGAGKPLVLVHGGLGAVDQMRPLLPSLAETRQVIAVELQGHGHTADIKRPWSFEQMADDLAALVRHLGLANADLLGYSLGGGAVLQAAFRHPEVVRKLVVVSAPHKSDAWYPEVRAGQKALTAEAAKGMVGSPPHQAYVRVAPKPEAWPTLVVKTGELVSRDYDWSPFVSALKMPTLIVVGDADSIRPSQTVEFYGLLGGGQRDAGWDESGMPNSRLAILPGTSHYSICSSPLLPGVVSSFLDAPMPNAR